MLGHVVFSHFIQISFTQSTSSASLQDKTAPVLLLLAPPPPPAPQQAFPFLVTQVYGSRASLTAASSFYGHEVTSACPSSTLYNWKLIGRDRICFANDLRNFRFMRMNHSGFQFKHVSSVRLEPKPTFMFQHSNLYLRAQFWQNLLEEH